MFVAELCKDIQVVIFEIVERMSSRMMNPNQDVSDSAHELLSKLITHCGCHYCCLIDMPNYISQLTSVMQCK